MVEDGYQWGSAGRERFTHDFGVIETIERITVEDNVSVMMDKPLRAAYEALEEEIRECLEERRGNSSVASTMLNALLAWPDHPYGFGTLYGSEFNPETGCRERFVIAETVDLDRCEIYTKERALIEEVKAQLARGRKYQIFAVYTHKYDVTARLEQLFLNEGIRAAILRASVPTHKREAWYREQLRRGIDACICHPKSSKPDSTFWISPPSCSTKRDTLCTPCARRAGDRGGSGGAGPWR